MTSVVARRPAWPARVASVLAIAAGLAAAGLALPRGATAAASVVVFTGVATTFLAVAILILERRPGNRVGPAMFVLGIVLAAYIALDAYVRQASGPPFAAEAAWLVGLFDGVWFTVLGLLILWFPDGRLPSRRWVVVPWLYVPMVACFCLGHAFAPGPLSYYPDIEDLANPFGVAGFPGDALLSVGYVLAGVSTALAATSLVARWRRAGAMERAQLKWAASAAPVVALTMGSYFVLFGSGYNAVADLAVSSSVGLFGVAIGVAILRYRLYDIDRLISRTLAYATLTLVLAGAYVVGFLAVQAALAPFTSTGGPVAVAASTLGAFLLFQPLRRRLRAAMDRRFNRSRYDAQRTIEAFVIRLRDEVDLAHLDEEISAVVGRTVSPVHARVWFRPTPGTPLS